MSLEPQYTDPQETFFITLTVFIFALALALGAFFAGWHGIEKFNPSHVLEVVKFEHKLCDDIDFQSTQGLAYILSYFAVFLVLVGVYASRSIRDSRIVRVLVISSVVLVVIFSGLAQYFAYLMNKWWPICEKYSVFGITVRHLDLTCAVIDVKSGWMQTDSGLYVPAYEICVDCWVRDCFTVPKKQLPKRPDIGMLVNCTVVAEYIDSTNILLQYDYISRCNWSTLRWGG